MKPIYSIILKYGFIGSLMAMLLIIVLFYAGKHPLLIPLFVDYRIILFGIFIFFALREFRSYYNNDLLQFWQGIAIGIGIYVIIGITVGVFIIVFSALQPAFHDQYVQGTISGLMLEKDQLINQGKITISEEEFERQVDLLKDSSTYVLAIDYFIKSCVVGFFITIILAVLLRKSEKRFGNDLK